METDGLQGSMKPAGNIDGRFPGVRHNMGGNVRASAQHGESRVRLRYDGANHCEFRNVLKMFGSRIGAAPGHQSAPSGHWSGLSIRRFSNST
jgi:hypothetical protein